MVGLGRAGHAVDQHRMCGIGLVERVDVQIERVEGELRLADPEGAHRHGFLGIRIIAIRLPAIGDRDLPAGIATMSNSTAVPGIFSRNGSSGARVAEAGWAAAPRALVRRARERAEREATTPTKAALGHALESCRNPARNANPLSADARAEGPATMRDPMNRLARLPLLAASSFSPQQRRSPPATAARRRPTRPPHPGIRRPLQWQESGWLARTDRAADADEDDSGGARSRASRRRREHARALARRGRRPGLRWGRGRAS